MIEAAIYLLIKIALLVGVVYASILSLGLTAIITSG